MHTKHLVGNGIYHFFRRLFLQAVASWLYPEDNRFVREKKSRQYLRNLKSDREMRISVIDKMKRAFVELRDAMAINIMVVYYVGFRQSVR